jgi:hypothetical protein
MKRGLLGFLVLVLAFVAAPARADSTHGSKSGVNGVLYDDCVDQPYRYSVNVQYGAGYRALTARLYGPDGGQVDSDYVAPDTNQASGTSTFRLCRPGDRYGTYTIRATVEWGASPESITNSSRLDDSHFRMRKPHTRTTLWVSTRRPAYGQVVAYRIRALDERPTGYYGTSAAWVFLQKKVDGHWVRILGSRAMTHRTGCVKVRLRYPYHHKPMRIRAVTEQTPRYARSTSPVVRIW